MRCDLRYFLTRLLAGKLTPDNQRWHPAGPGSVQNDGKKSFMRAMTANPDTIAAIATPSGRGGIGIIKISGAKSFPIASAIFRPGNSCLNSAAGSAGKSQGAAPLNFKSHRIYYGHIVDPDTDILLDEVLVSAMKAPQTYTREDVVEINAHGGAVAVHAILKLVLNKGARMAEPGEFTRRAFLNGRIDLTQAEAVIDIINARTQKNLELATGHISGRLWRILVAVRNTLTDVLTRVEAAIDFPDDVTELIEPDHTAKARKKDAVQPLKRLIRDYVDAHVFRDGLSVAVVGRPNVGKSSLLNQLVKKDRAIVTPIPGTTRDVIEETLNIEGIPVIISDTAGVHETENPVERIGIEKTIAHVNGSDLVLFMIEANSPLGPADQQIYEQIKSKPVFVLLNKIDLTRAKEETSIPDAWTHEACLRISALYDEGIDLLREEMVKWAAGENPVDLAEAIVTNLRHKLLLEKALAGAETIVDELQKGTTSDLVAIHLQEAIDTLGEVTGDSAKVDVLDQIFSRFCVGK
jgi:tRNA modification GTPase